MLSRRNQKRIHSLWYHLKRAQKWAKPNSGVRSQNSGYSWKRLMIRRHEKDFWIPSNVVFLDLCAGHIKFLLLGGASGSRYCFSLKPKITFLGGNILLPAGILAQREQKLKRMRNRTDLWGRTWVAKGQRQSIEWVKDSWSRELPVFPVLPQVDTTWDCICSIFCGLRTSTTIASVQKAFCKWCFNQRVTRTSILEEPWKYPYGLILIRKLSYVKQKFPSG